MAIVGNVVRTQLCFDIFQQIHNNESVFDTIVLFGMHAGVIQRTNGTVYYARKYSARKYG